MTRLIALGKSTVPSWTQYIYSKHLLYQALPYTTHKHDYLESYPCQAHSPCSRVNIERGECLIHSADHYIIIGSISGYLLYAAGESVTRKIFAHTNGVHCGVGLRQLHRGAGGPGTHCIAHRKATLKGDSCLDRNYPGQRNLSKGRAPVFCFW